MGCDNLLNAIALGPVAVAIDLSHMISYKSGILTDCGTKPIPNSGSLVVGVADNYWKLKEALGATWGENGYIRIGRGNTCAVC